MRLLALVILTINLIATISSGQIEPEPHYEPELWKCPQGFTIKIETINLGRFQEETIKIYKQPLGKTLWRKKNVFWSEFYRISNTDPPETSWTLTKKEFQQEFEAFLDQPIDFLEYASWKHQCSRIY